MKNTNIREDSNINFDMDLIDNPTPDNNIGILTIKTANDWINEAKARPVPRMLFDSLWFEHELCFLFADTNVGKSILAVQIADSISRGIPIRGFKLESCAQSVIYADFEMSDKQFEARYSNNYQNHYKFSDLFYRVEINPDGNPDENYTFEDQLNNSLELIIEETKSKILIIDNLTYLREGTETAKDALPLMKSLKALKTKFNLSILVLAHTPKRNQSNPITRNDLQGSKMLINFCDSAFAIGESFNDKHLRYIKQIKQRGGEWIYDTNNVIVCEITKPEPDCNFLQFSFISFGKERDHLRSIGEEERDQLIERAVELYNKGISQRQIAKELGLAVSTINKYVNK